MHPICESTFELFLYIVGSTMRLSPTRNQKVPLSNTLHMVILTQKSFLSHPKLILVNLKVALKSPRSYSCKPKTFIILVFAVNPVEALQEFWQMKVVFILIIIIIITIIIITNNQAGREETELSQGALVIYEGVPSNRSNT